MKKVFNASMLFMMAALLMAVAGLLVTAGCSVSTASLSNVKTCEKLDGDQCASDMSTLDNEAPVFYVTANLDNAPSDTKIKIDWRYLSGEIGNEPKDIDSVSFISEDNSNIMQSSLERSTDAWPKGEYEVVLKIETDNADPIHKKFSVK